jgi:hypothetical protein
MIVIPLFQNKSNKIIINNSNNIIFFYDIIIENHFLCNDKNDVNKNHFYFDRRANIFILLLLNY